MGGTLFGVTQKVKQTKAQVFLEGRKKREKQERGWKVFQVLGPERGVAGAPWWERGSGGVPWDTMCVPDKRKEGGGKKNDLEDRECPGTRRRANQTKGVREKKKN